MSMKSKAEIEMDFSRAINQAQELEEVAGELTSIATSNVDEMLDLLRGSWKGDNSELFLKSGRLISSDILATADDLMKVARNIRATAGIVYKAEKAALQIIY